jgi:hypothetical protein
VQNAPFARLPHVLTRLGEQMVHSALFARSGRFWQFLRGIFLCSLL